MSNIIKVLDMQNFVQILEDDFKYKEDIEKVCRNIELDEELKKIFFYYDKQDELHFYESKNEKQLLLYLTKYNTAHVMKLATESHEVFYDYGKKLYEARRSKNISINVDFGSIIITKETFYKTLRLEYLNKQGMIDRLIEAEDFFDELDDIKKECLELVLDEITVGTREFIIRSLIENIIE